MPALGGLRDPRRGGLCVCDAGSPRGGSAGSSGEGSRVWCVCPGRLLCPSAAWASLPPTPGWGALRGGAYGAAAAALSRAVGEVRGTGAREPACWVGEGGLARLRLVARSRHYAGRHFLSDPGEERLGDGRWRAGLWAGGERARSVSLRGPVSTSALCGRRPRDERAAWACLCTKTRLICLNPFSPAAGDLAEWPAGLGVSSPQRDRHFRDRRRHEGDASTLRSCAGPWFGRTTS